MQCRSHFSLPCTDYILLQIDIRQSLPSAWASFVQQTVEGLWVLLWKIRHGIRRSGVFTSCLLRQSDAKYRQARRLERQTCDWWVKDGVRCFDLHVREWMRCRLQLVCLCPTGVLTQQVTDKVMKPYGRTYIPASYVKYVESGGSRVMPIKWVGGDGTDWSSVERKMVVFSPENCVPPPQTDSYHCGVWTHLQADKWVSCMSECKSILCVFLSVQDDLVWTLSCLLSLLLIGGAVDLETSDFARVAKVFYTLALKVSSYICYISFFFLLISWVSNRSAGVLPTYAENE